MQEAWSWRDREAFVRDLSESSKALANLSAALGSLPTATSNTGEPTSASR